MIIPASYSYTELHDYMLYSEGKPCIYIRYVHLPVAECTYYYCAFPTIYKFPFEMWLT